MLAAVFEGFGIGFLLAFLQNLVSVNPQPVRSGIEWIDIWILGINESSLHQLYRISVLILLSTWLRAVFNYLAGFYMTVARIRLVNRLYKQIFEQLQAVQISFFSQTRVGALVNTLTSEVGQLNEAMKSFSHLITRGLVILIYAAVLLYISWQLSLVAILLFSLTAVGLSNLNRRVRQSSFPISKARGSFSALATEFINGIRTIQAFATQGFERRRFYATSDEIARTEIDAARVTIIVRPLGEALAGTILVGMIVVGVSSFGRNNGIQVASLLTFLFVLIRLVPAIQEVLACLTAINGFQGAIHTIEELLNRDNKPYLQNGHRKFTGLQRGIEFVSVDFSYGQGALVLKNITLSIDKGQTIALVGASGAGKSTLADLIPRFYDPTQGEIRFDSINLREFDLDSVRRRMAVVSQDTFIFNASIRDNIAYGLNNVDEDAILEAARLANALEFIQALPRGLDTVLGDRGVLLSGGQRQRIAIARALLRNPEILILDEATSALDSVSEHMIQASLEKLSIGRTVIAIAHRLSTIANADKVIVMDQGQIVEQGTYQELLGRKGRFWKYHQIQHQY
ncbi:ABC transporter ATP-binding protein [Thermocoleostomius sinensis A174]|uniref:ABC transporter ATP-binding protein n=2 Tax=Thermocoleostomius TaxID=3065395 RepID=A0A9E8ZAN0_9CYAN|nr:heterocyst formation ABC transporter subunit HepA [Thermocoleostomius sinensis]WAL58377.1 ABC transporter ATP-binding protein [Thermocoleostomius sinensis A174]